MQNNFTTFRPEIKDVTIFSYELKNLIGELKESGIKECIKLGETL